MTQLAKTDKQRKRDQRNRLLAAEFRSFRASYPDAPDAQIVRTIAQGGKFNLSEPGIKRILYATGVLKVTKPRA